MNNEEMAFHQAGHIVMAMLWGVWRVDKVSIAGTGSSEGAIEYARVTEMQGKELWQRLGTQLFDAKLERMMGGPVARAILQGSDVVYEGGTGDSDFAPILSAIQEDTPDGRPEDAWMTIRAHEPVVQSDLKRMWPVVEALAQALIAKQELSDFEIRSLVRKAVNTLPENDRTWAISRLRSPAPVS